MRLKYTKKPLNEAVPHTVVRVVQNELVGNFILIAAGKESIEIKATDLLDYILVSEEAEAKAAADTVVETPKVETPNE